VGCEVHIHGKCMDEWLGRLKREHPHIEYVVFATDNSPTQYRLARAFQYYRMLSDKHKLPILVTFMAESHGKGKWDGAGGYFYRVYAKHSVLYLRDKNRNLPEFCAWFNKNRKFPQHCQKIWVNGTTLLLTSFVKYSVMRKIGTKKCFYA